MRRLLLFYILFVVYGSLFPFQFYGRHLEASPLWYLFHSWPAEWSRFVVRDLIVNIVLYMPLGAAGFLALARRHWLSAGLSLAAGTALSAALEMTQLFDRSRSCSTSDLFANVAGTALGVLAGAAFRAPAIRRLRAAGSVRLSGPILLLVFWMGYQTFPLFPNLGHTRLAAALHYMADPAHFSWIELALGFAEWLALGALLEEAVGPQRARRVMPCLGAVVLLRLILVGRELGVSEVVAAVLGWAAWRWIFSRLPARVPAVATVLFAAVLLRGIAPFHFHAPAGVFHWAPFRATLETEIFSSAVMLLRKTFDYGAGVWLLAAAGLGLARAGVAAAVFLGALEVAQLYLPPHTAEITDPLLALALALALGVAQKGDRRIFPLPRAS